MKFIQVLLVLISGTSAYADVFVSNRTQIQEFVDKGEGQQRFILVDLQKLRPVTLLWNGNFEIDFGNGDVATLSRYRHQGRVYSKGSINEMTCLPAKMATTCEATQDFLQSFYRVVWKSHSNPEKVGRYLRLKREAFEIPEGIALPPTREAFTGSFTWSYETQFEKFSPIRPDNPLVQQMQPTSIRCQSMEWAEELSQRFGNKGQNFEVDEWSTEFMFQNPETGIAVNTTVGSFFGVNMAMDSKTIWLNNIDFMASQLGFFGNNLFFGDVIGWSLSNGQDYCDVSMTFDLAPIQQAFVEAENQTMPENMVVVDSLSSEALDIMTKNNLSNFKSATLETKVPEEVLLNAKLGLLSSPQYLNEEFVEKGSGQKVNVQILEYGISEVAL